MAYMEKRFSEEASGVVGHVLPTPTETGNPNPGTESVSTGLEQKLKNLGGQVALVPSMTSDWQATGAMIGSSHDWTPKRLGMDPPQAQVVLRSDVGMSILNACGVPAELVAGKAEGTAAREGWRRFLHGSVDPVARIVAQELSEKLERDVTLDLSGLHASDIQGRARAFQSVVGGGRRDVDCRSGGDRRRLALRLAVDDVPHNRSETAPHGNEHSNEDAYQPT